MNEQKKEIWSLDFDLISNHKSTFEWMKKKNVGMDFMKTFIQFIFKGLISVTSESGGGGEPTWRLSTHLQVHKSHFQVWH